MLCHVDQELRSGFASAAAAGLAEHMSWFAWADASLRQSSVFEGVAVEKRPEKVAERVASVLSVVVGVLELKQWWVVSDGKLGSQRAGRAAFGGTAAAGAAAASFEAGAAAAACGVGAAGGPCAFGAVVGAGKTWWRSSRNGGWGCESGWNAYAPSLTQCAPPSPKSYHHASSIFQRQLNESAMPLPLAKDMHNFD